MLGTTSAKFDGLRFGLISLPNSRDATEAYLPSWSVVTPIPVYFL
jgi:hypothetical protein